MRRFNDIIQSEFVTSREMISSSSAEVFRNSAFANTTYSSSFTFPGRPATPRFHNYVSFVLPTEDKLVPRCFPHFALHISPHRILDFERSALGFSPTGAEYSDADQRKQPEADAEVNEADEVENDGAENSENFVAADISESKREESEEADSRNQEDKRADTKNSENVSIEGYYNKPIEAKFFWPQTVLYKLAKNYVLSAFCHPARFLISTDASSTGSCNTKAVFR